jgi:predicted ArsR family transcriptional regulator
MEHPDTHILNLLRQSGGMSVAELARSAGVTATAIRQRLTRLLSQGLIQRETQSTPRGRPSHRYLLTARAREQAGNNFADLAAVLWDELRAIPDVAVRRGLLQRIAQRLATREPDETAEVTSDEAAKTSLDERLDSLSRWFQERRIPFAVERSAGKLPVLQALECPYPTLAEQDRGICAVERMLFSQLLAEDVKLSECRLDGHRCCQFEVRPSADILVDSAAAT